MQGDLKKSVWEGFKDALWGWGCSSAQSGLLSVWKALPLSPSTKKKSTVSYQGLCEWKCDGPGESQARLERGGPCVGSWEWEKAYVTWGFWGW